jgi:hypothetical protein
MLGLEYPSVYILAERNLPHRSSIEADITVERKNAARPTPVPPALNAT